MTRISLRIVPRPFRLDLRVEEVETIDTTGESVPPPSQLAAARPALAKCLPVAAPALRLAGGRRG
jgi:hypothetical protein